ncbi:MAG: phosphoserine phosphatase [Xanthobacteraceae bacterium]|nr:MAG: phosphoserine phosphatase [Xanthobacteraceae bacterium]
MELGRRDTLRLAADALTNVRRHSRNRGKPLGERLEIEAGTADEDRQHASGLGRDDLGLHGRNPAADREILGGVHGAVEPVRRRRHLPGRGAGGDDGEIAIDLHGIGIDDDAAEVAGQVQRQCRLAAGGRTCDEDGPRPVTLAGIPIVTHVATLIANPANPSLGKDAVRAAASRLAGAGEPVVLDPGIAVDIPFALQAGADNRMIAADLRQALAGHPVDVVVQPAAGRAKRLFLADMDSTMIGQECIDELADLVGLKDHVSAITERAMRGEIAFEPALRERVALLKGLSAAVVDDVIDRRITLTPGGRELVRTMKARGGYTALVSGGFTLFTARIGSMIGFHENRANLLEVEDGLFAGTVREPILGREAKRDTLVELRQRLGLAAADTMAVGDGANDLAMLGEAGVGVAYHAKPKVAEAAAVRVDHGDLSALLYMQGYARADFVL